MDNIVITVESVILTFLPIFGAYLSIFITSSEEQIKTWYAKLDKPKWKLSNRVN
jgi:tryptophan-rich sensory protein